MNTDFKITIVIIVVFAVLLCFLSRVQGVKTLTNNELYNINNIIETVCKNNGNGFKQINFYPSTKYQIDVTCKNNAKFEDISYTLWKRNKQ